MYQLYYLKSTLDDKIYIGITNNPNRRYFDLMKINNRKMKVYEILSNEFGLSVGYISKIKLKQSNHNGDRQKKLIII